MESLLVKGKLPNLRSLIIPNSGDSLIDMDLARADMQVVAWDSGCARLKQLFREEALEIERAWNAGELPDPEKDVHTTNAKELFGKADKRYRDLGKKVGHAADYLITAKRCAQDAGILVKEAERFLAKWFYLHPEIITWHKAKAQQLASTRTITNAFGYRRIFFGRIEECLPEAVAWTPQSTVGIVINHAICNIGDFLKGVVRLLLQVHDSALMACRTDILHETLQRIRGLSSITIPYPDPLIIPVGFKVSESSWGDCKDYLRIK